MSGDVNAAAETLANRPLTPEEHAYIAALVAEVEQLRGDVRTLDADLDDTRVDIEQLRAERDAARKEVNTERARFVRDLDALRVEKQQLEERLANAVLQLAEYAEGLIEPGDLDGGIEWLIREESQARVREQRLQEALRNLYDDCVKSNLCGAAIVAAREALAATDPPEAQ